MRNGKTVLCEVGVGGPSMCFCLLYLDRPDMEFLMFEPNPKFFNEVKVAIGDRKNFEIHNVAIGDENGVMDFIDEGTSSSLVGIASPFAQHYKKPDSQKPIIKVEVRKISEFDRGDIDILRIDTEGSEYFSLKHLVSRPREIVLETHNDLATYINPYLFEICEWARLNGYQLTSVAAGDHTYTRVSDITGFVENPTANYSDQGQNVLFYEEAVKKTLILHYTRYLLNTISSEEFVDTLARMFRLKKKMIGNIAKYVQKEVEVRNNPIDKVLENIGFFAPVFREYIHKDNGQPIHKYYNV